MCYLPLLPRPPGRLISSAYAIHVHLRGDQVNLRIVRRLFIIPLCAFTFFSFKRSDLDELMDLLPFLYGHASLGKLFAVIIHADVQPRSDTQRLPKQLSTERNK